MAAVRRIGRGGAVAPAVTLLVLATSGIPALASTGVDIDCAKSGHRQLEETTIVAPTLAARTESELHSIVTAASDESSETVEVSKEESQADADDGVTTRRTAPTISTRLPGVSESSLPSFRRQMNRTDI